MPHITFHFHNERKKIKRKVKRTIISADNRVILYVERAMLWERREGGRESKGRREGRRRREESNLQGERTHSIVFPDQCNAAP